MVKKELLNPLPLSKWVSNPMGNRNKYTVERRMERFLRIGKIIWRSPEVMKNVIEVKDFSSEVA